ncbi:MAG TPA: hypothetical protein ENJ31_06665 [Anaerolineae bacterium]|nr:hypothetical protein [Anaerolineae bacterium]
MPSQQDLPTYYAQAVASLVAELPAERAAQVYDFARFLQNQPVPVLTIDQDEDWLYDSEEQMRAEDTLWEETLARHRDKFDALLQAAYAEIEAGTTQPMFDSEGNLITHGRPVAILLSPKDESEIERLLLTYSPQFQTVLQTARQQIREGQGISHTDFWQEIEAEANE